MCALALVVDVAPPLALALVLAVAFTVARAPPLHLDSDVAQCSCIGSC